MSAYEIIAVTDFHTAWKVSKYRVISGPYFPVFGLNTGKYGPEIIPYLDTFCIVSIFQLDSIRKWWKSDSYVETYIEYNLFLILKDLFSKH